MSDPPPDDLIGAHLASQFAVIARLGEGGMGAVYLAEQADMGRRVVIKVMHPELSVGSAVERFKREARAIAALNHPHIVQVYVFGHAPTPDGADRLYLAMEYIDGRDLTAEIARGPMPVARALRILDAIAGALVEAHSRGIVHRDLKPDNVMLTSRHGNADWVKVLDFGIAKIAEGNDLPALTKEGVIFGTPRYMAPEQITAGAIDARTDLYALGVILHEMLSGDHPFRAETAMDFYLAHVQTPYAPLAARRPELGLPPALDALLTRLLAKAPADRYTSAAELQRDLRAILAGLGEPLSHTLSMAALDLPTPTPTPSGRGRLALALAAAGVATIGAVVVIVLASSGTAPTAPEPQAPPTDAATTNDAVSATDAASAATTNDAANAASATDAATPTRPPEAPPTPDLPRPGAPIAGLPVPEGTTLVDDQLAVLTLESTLEPRAILAFYQHELAGRVKPIGNGLLVTDPTSPWDMILLSRNADRITLRVNRRATP